MNRTRKNIFGKLSIFVAASFITLAVITPISQSLAINKQTGKLLTTEDFSITIHRIKEEDEIDPWPHGDPDWQLNMYVNDEKINYQCVGTDIIVDKTFIWPDIIKYGDEYVYIKMELKDLDPWPDTNDIADISAYYGGGPDNTNEFPRGAVFLRTYNLIAKDWEPVDENNDYLNTEYQSPLIWYITSGNYDGSTVWDENDATVWFNISIGNAPPYPPEKPTGTDYGWQGNIYDFSTKGYDPDGEQIQFGWDWDNDGLIDEFTGFYNSWETDYVSHLWTEGGIYYVRVIAIDSRGLAGEWSEPLKVKINSPYGINGAEVEEWSLGHVYTFYFDHAKTQEILQALESGGNVIAAVSALITAIATACGLPVPYVVIIAIVTAIVRLGCEIIYFLDHGMGIYVKFFIVEVYGVPTNVFCYPWSQSADEGEGQPPEGNIEPCKPETPTGRSVILPGREYSFSTVATDPDEDKITYIFEWGDGNYSCSDIKLSGERTSMSHTWEKKGKYQIRIKVLDLYGQESEWSDPLDIRTIRDKQYTTSVFINILDKFMDIFDFHFFKQALYFLN